MMADLPGAAAASASLCAPGQDTGHRLKLKPFKGGQLSTSNAGMHQVLMACPTLKKGFDTALFMSHPLVQTFIGSAVRSAKLTIERSLECNLSDGGLVTIDLSSPGKLSNHLALVIPGAAGGSDVPYVRSLAKRLFDAGFLVAILNRRGTTAHTPLKTSEPLQYAKTSDLLAAIALLQETFPGFTMFAVGVSIGANLMLKTLGEHPDCGVTFAVSVANGYDFIRGSMYLEQTNPALSKVISGDMIQRLILPWEETLNTSHGINVREVFANCTGMRDFDERLSKTFFGFASVDEYYASCTCVPVIDRISIPFVCINALDDPIAHANILPVDQVSQSAKGAIILTDHGGHQGWINSVSCIWGHSWIENLVADLFQQMITAHKFM
jgi:predicted alpha/beta-fold hydrolase